MVAFMLGCLEYVRFCLMHHGAAHSVRCPPPCGRGSKPRSRLVLPPTCSASFPPRQRGEARGVALRPLVGERMSLDHVIDGFRDVGGVIADALDVLGAEHEMDAEGDVARV